MAIVWDATTGTQIATSTCHAQQIASARFSPDGAYVVTASVDKTACVWSAANGMQVSADNVALGPLRGHTAEVELAVWLPDGKRVVTASADGTARVWHAEKGKMVVAPLRHERGSEVYALAVSSDGRRVVTAGSDGVAHVWELPVTTPEDGSTTMPHEVATLVGHKGSIVDVAFSPDDALIATAGTDRVAKVWDANTGRVRATFEHDEDVKSVAFTAGGAKLVTGSIDGSARIWSTQISKTRLDVASPVHALAGARDGTIAAGTDKSAVVLVRNGQPALLLGHLGRVLAAAFTADGTQLVTGGEDTALIVWDVATGTRRGTLAPMPDGTRALRISADGTVAAATKDGVQLWSLASGERTTVLVDAATTVTCVVFGPGTLVFGGSDDGAVIAWDRTHLDLAEKRRVTFPGGVAAIALSPDGATLAVAGQGAIELIDVRDGHLGTPRRRVYDPSGGLLRAVGWSADGTRLVSAGSDGARIWDAASGTQLGARDAGMLDALVIDGDTLWTGGEDHSVDAWDVHVETRPVAELDGFVARHGTWRLGPGDELHEIRHDGVPR
jgi:WD40 repeat protein